MKTLIEIQQDFRLEKILYLKVAFNPTQEIAIVEVVDQHLNLKSSQLFSNNDGDNYIEQAKINMINQAGYYTNKGYFCIINPFTN